MDDKLATCNRQKCKKEYVALEKLRDTTKKEMVKLLLTAKDESTKINALRDISLLTKTLSESPETKDLMKCGLSKCREELRSHLKEHVDMAQFLLGNSKALSDAGKSLKGRLTLSNCQNVTSTIIRLTDKSLLSQ
jgi:hypothetical protein